MIKHRHKIDNIDGLQIELDILQSEINKLKEEIKILEGDRI